MIWIMMACCPTLLNYNPGRGVAVKFCKKCDDMR